MAVVIFHIDENLLVGGFLGVDLFFLISGFVVTKSITETSNFRLSTFYTKRFFRLMPTAAFVVMTTSLIWIIFFEAIVDIEFGLSALSSLFGLANFNFMFMDGYWSDDLKSNPFLHFWSLGVEEQYYLLWPFFVLAIFNLKKLTSPALILIAIISFTLRRTILWC